MGPDEISKALGVSPSFSRKVGERRATPKGQPLEGTNEDTFWCSKPVRGEGFALATDLASHLAEMEAHRPFLLRFCSSGGTIEYFIGWFTNGLNVGEIFGWQLLRKLSELRISLSFDIYGGEDGHKG